MKQSFALAIFLSVVLMQGISADVEISMVQRSFCPCGDPGCFSGEESERWPDDDGVFSSTESEEESDDGSDDVPYNMGLHLDVARFMNICVEHCRGTASEDALREALTWLFAMIFLGGIETEGDASCLSPFLAFDVPNLFRITRIVIGDLDMPVDSDFRRLVRIFWDTWPDPDLPYEDCVKVLRDLIVKRPTKEFMRLLACWGDSKVYDYVREALCGGDFVSEADSDSEDEASCDAS